VDKYPTASFVSQSFKPLADGASQLTGELTLHGITQPVVIDVVFIGAGEDPWGGYRRGYRGTTTIKRSDYNMSYDLGPMADSMVLDFFIEGIRK